MKEVKIAIETKAYGEYCQNRENSCMFMTWKLRDYNNIFPKCTLFQCELKKSSEQIPQRCNQCKEKFSV